MKNAIYFQGGGPTAVINASFEGLYEAYKKDPERGKLFVSPYGLNGLINGTIEEVKDQDYSSLLFRPGSHFGSSRIKVKPDDDISPKIAETLRKNDIHVVFGNGGNDTMLTCYQLFLNAKKLGYSLQVIGIPKTIDNDLLCMDHTPGYGSAAKYIANATIGCYLDAYTYPKQKAYIIEAMGRDSGYLAAASKLAALKHMGPDFIYVPERPFSLADFLAKVEKKEEEKGQCIVVVSEGIRDKDGKLIAESGNKDAFGNPLMGGVSSFLAGQLENAGVKSRPIELNVIQRAAFFSLSLTDVKEAELVGKKAYLLAKANKTGKMVTLARKNSNPYKAVTGTADLMDVAKGVQSLPDKFINEKGDNITDEFLSYAAPLIQGDVKNVFEKDGLLKL